MLFDINIGILLFPFIILPTSLNNHRLCFENRYGNVKSEKVLLSMSSASPWTSLYRFLKLSCAI